MNLYQDRYSDPKANAQDQLSGRTHYVDDGTLRFHKARILEAFAACNGLAFCIIESTALDMHNTKRGYRPVVFDVFGTVVNDRAKLEDCTKTKAPAVKALREFLASFDAQEHTLAAIDREEANHKSDCADMRAKLRGLTLEEDA